jgi:hypothetical protein
MMASLPWSYRRCHRDIEICGKHGSDAIYSQAAAHLWKTSPAAGFMHRSLASGFDNKRAGSELVSLLTE